MRSSIKPYRGEDDRKQVLAIAYATASRASGSPTNPPVITGPVITTDFGANLVSVSGNDIVANVDCVVIVTLQMNGSLVPRNNVHLTRVNNDASETNFRGSYAAQAVNRETITVPMYLYAGEIIRPKLYTLSTHDYNGILRIFAKRVQ